VTAKIMISVSDELKAMIDEYNKTHPFEKLHISEIAQKAIYEKITGKSVKTASEVVFESLTNAVSKNESKLESIDSDKPVIPCPICGKQFVQTKPTRKYCSKNCATTASKRRNRA
jgi:hypothetical protein